MNFKEFYDRPTPELILPIGIPGSGKSTWIREFNKNNKYIVVSPDEIRKDVMKNGYDSSKNSQVFKIAFDTTRKALQHGDSVIFDATNVDTRQRRDLISAMPKNIKLKAKILKVDPQEAKRRIKHDIESGKDRANVPPDVVDRMLDKFIDTLKVIDSEGFELI